MNDDVPRHADVVVVGAGTAGCVMAGRLAAAGWDVVLLEAGAHRAGTRAGLMDIGPSSDVVRRVPARLDGRSVELPRGHTVGGSGAVNGGYCLAPRPVDLRCWPSGWGPRLWWGLARAAERLRPKVVAPDRLARQIAQAFPASTVRIGQARRAGLRVTAFDAWDPVGAGARLCVGTEVRDLLWRGGRAGGHCRGVVTSDGVEIVADHVVLCAGTVGSARLLLTAGIGPATGHRVAERMEEHPEVLLELGPSRPSPYRPGPPGDPDAAASASGTADPAAPGRDARTQPLQPLLAQVNRLVLDDGASDAHTRPEIEIRPYSMPFSVAVPGLETQPQLLGVSLMNPRGRAALTGCSDAATVDLDAHPDPFDARALDLAVSLVADRLVLESPPIRSTSQHLSGSARIGEVVDEDGRVLGVTGLRVADASVLPRLTRCGPYLTVLAVAEVLADRLLDELRRPGRPVTRT